MKWVAYGGGMQLLTPDQATYPVLLRAGLSPSPSLYIEGGDTVFATPCISVIGSRKCSAYGERVLKFLIPPLVQAGLAIVSGLAYGIDGLAHQIALQHKGKCVAVLGSGFNKIYPATHNQLAQKIVQAGGCLITEYSPDTEPRPFHFPKRNRIIAALSRVTLVVEAGEKSGSLITANHAIAQNREIAVVLGDIFHPNSAGCYKLLKEGALPVTAPEDILNLYQEHIPCFIQERIAPALTGVASNLYDCILRGYSTVQQMGEQTGLESKQLLSILSVLELDGYITFQNSTWRTTS